MSENPPVARTRYRPVVLVALGDPFQLELVTEVCQAAGWAVMTAADGEAALDSLSRRVPALIVASEELAEVDGRALARIVRGDSALEGVPFVLVGDSDDSNADAVLPLKLRVDSLQQTLSDMLLAARDRRRRRRSDSQPAVPGDRAQLLISLSYEQTEAERTSRPLSCVVLRADAETLDGLVLPTLERVRKSDLVFRASSDELVLLLPETDTAGLHVLLERLAPATRPARLGVATFPSTVRDVLEAARRDAD